MLTRACCCGGDPPTIGCVGGGFPANACITVQLQGVQGLANALMSWNPLQPGQLISFAGYNTTYKWTGRGSGRVNFPGTGSVTVQCVPSNEWDECHCNAWTIGGTGLLIQFQCIDDQIRVFGLDIWAGGTWQPSHPFDCSWVNPPTEIFRFGQVPGRPLNSPIPNRLTGTQAIATGGTATVNVTAGPCPGLLASKALRSADPDAVARQVAALREPLTRQRRASGCRGCGDAGGDEIL